MDTSKRGVKQNRLSVTKCLKGDETQGHGDEATEDARRPWEWRRDTHRLTVGLQNFQMGADWTVLEQGSVSHVRPAGQTLLWPVSKHDMVVAATPTHGCRASVPMAEPSSHARRLSAHIA